MFSFHRLSPLLVFILLCSCPWTSFAQEGQQQALSEPADVLASLSEHEERLQTARGQLISIAQAVQDRRKHLETLRQQMVDAETASERAEIEAEIEELDRLLQAARTTFETVATGGVDSSIFRDEPEQPFNWQQDLFEIVEPFLDQLKKMTEVPRNIELLNREILKEQARLSTVDRALSNIVNVKAGVEDEHVRERLQRVEQNWQQRRAELQLEIELLEARLRELREERDTFFNMLHQGMLSFVQGRGLILVLAIAVTGSVWFLLQSLPRLLRRKSTEQVVAVRKPHSRMLTIGYQGFCLLMTLFALLLVLYVSGDWLLLGLAMVILVLVVLGSRTYLPRFMTETRMLLDMGPVREGERVLFNGIPWQVKTLNLYSILCNPELQGGVLRLPLIELSGMISRPDDPEEPWFPTRKGDFVMLNDGTFGQVLLQTPEIVQLKHVGAVRTFSTGDFLACSPRNISRNGFGFAVTFGIDYQHQTICLDVVPGILDAAVTEALRASAVGDGLESVLVDFKEAGASSLDYIIYVGMSGKVADSYWTVGRIIQQTCVRVCNERGWVIPFSQLTVHQGEGFDSLRVARS
ncbi:hypothetical protein [Desulfobulbus alkaliphilus]|uniref:hypothetical protein n=1 Tax=Desulfobulbus alkaliphilus TaxID=869814 RepID=UPI001964CE94|nr:hypothetical protein [Desulfobulbus alkaliphilus]MBM9536400.1 hypothetical protein [Desulfobulbus alkaliphilus]